MDTAKRVKRYVDVAAASRGVTKKEIAEQLGMTPRNLNKRLSTLGQLEFLEELARILNVPLSALVEADPERVVPMRDLPEPGSTCNNVFAGQELDVLDLVEGWAGSYPQAC